MNFQTAVDSGRLNYFCHLATLERGHFKPLLRVHANWDSISEPRSTIFLLGSCPSVRPPVQTNNGRKTPTH
jgi:hypothetical protein